MQTTRNPDGTQTHFDPRTGTKVHTDTGGHIDRFERPGLAATNFRADGRAGHIVQTRSDGSTLVVSRAGNGREVYVERPVRNRAGYVSRTSVSGGRTRVLVYRTETYNSVAYPTYVPARYYQPAFYQWAGRPWGPKVAYSWGPPAPWFYGGYFAPEPVYDSPALWLTDFLLVANLRMAYASQQQDSGAAPQVSTTPLTPEVKFAIAEDVKQQIATADPSIPPAPTPPGTKPEAPVLKQKIFMVSSSLDVVSIDNGSMCTLSPGDVIQRTPRIPVTGDGKVTVDVMNSKGGCPEDFRTQLEVAQLQDMRNEERAQLAEGMGNIADGQAKGLPSGPPAGAKSWPDGQPPAPAGEDSQLDREASQLEASIQQSAGSGK
jgi:hypothetical protein